VVALVRNLEIPRWGTDDLNPTAISIAGYKSHTCNCIISQPIDHSLGLTKAFMARNSLEPKCWNAPELVLNVATYTLCPKKTDTYLVCCNYYVWTDFDNVWQKC